MRLRASQIGASGQPTERLVAICNYRGADTYITDEGANGYLDHEQFEDADIAVNLMIYRRACHPQLRATFTPYVSILDLIANCGKDRILYLNLR